MTILQKFKEKKFLCISIAFHITIICTAIIVIHFWRSKPKAPIKIQEVELFNPIPQQKEQPLTPQPHPLQKKKESLPTPQSPIKTVSQKFQKKPLPKPLKSDLKNNIIDKWQSIEKKNR